MKKWIVDVKESQFIEGQKSFTTSSHIIDGGESMMEVWLTFAKKCFPNEKIQSVREYDPLNS